MIIIKSLIYQPKIKCKDGGFIFFRKSKIQTVGKGEKEIQLFRFRNS